MCSADIFLGLLAVLFPPLPVWVKCGICSADSLINILLSLLGYIPGLLHAWYVIARYPEPPYEYESLPQHNEGGRVTYVYVQAPNNQQPHPQPHPQQHQQAKSGAQHGGMNYGTQNSAQNHSAQPQQHAGSSNAGEGSSNNHESVPPSYADVVAGDHKVQPRD
jgi:uncharacterized membrane protein YqaE (UPF0057 family)